MKSIKTLIISGAVTLVMALPLSGMAKGHKHDVQINAASVCVAKAHIEGQSTRDIGKKYCVKEIKTCISMIKSIVAQVDVDDPKNVLVLKARGLGPACKALAAQCKQTDCFSNLTPSS